MAVRAMQADGNVPTPGKRLFAFGARVRLFELCVSAGAEGAAGHGAGSVQEDAGRGGRGSAEDKVHAAAAGGEFAVLIPPPAPRGPPRSPPPPFRSRARATEPGLFNGPVPAEGKRSARRRLMRF